MIKLYQAQNGFYLELYDDETLELTDRIVSEITSDEEDHMPQAMQKILYAIIDYMGASGSRYSKQRISIDLKPGDKCESIDSNDGDTKEFDFDDDN